VTVDQILAKLEDPSIEPGFQDPRNCLVFWARPPAAVRTLIAEVQRRLLSVAPSLWTMPQDNLHMTAMEVTHSLTAPEIEALVETLEPNVEAIANYTAGVKVASRYVVPSAHLTIGRFITKKDFETANGEIDHTKVSQLVATIESINAWLQEEYWPTDGKIQEGGEWIIGQEKGLECRKGTLWYGGGERIHLGKGF
jgi:hypothetical protein